MRTIKITVAYDGTDFHGWQIQPGQPTVQGELSEIASRLAQEQVTVHGAGRTDAGVHAWGQVAHFQTNSSLAPEDFARAFNALLPPSIRVRSAEEACADFHARWMALAKTYQYTIYRGRVVPPFRWRYVLHAPDPLDFEAMAAAARLFEGEHDFTTFAASTGSDEEDKEKTMVRTIHRSEIVSGSAWSRAENRPGALIPAPVAGLCEDEWAYVVRGKSFLRYMVRKIVGTLLEVGRGRMTPADVAFLFDLRDRSRSGPTVPPHGLCLLSVEYPDSTASSSEPAALPGPPRS